MQEYKVEKVMGMSVNAKATDIMNAYAAKGWTVFRTEVLGSHLIIIFERDK